MTVNVCVCAIQKRLMKEEDYVCAPVLVNARCVLSEHTSSFVCIHVPACDIQHNCVDSNGP